MSKFLLILISLMIPSLVQASWSRYAYVSPETESEFELKVYVAPADKSNETYVVRLKAVSFPFKQAWVITTPKPLSPENQNQRNRFWSEEMNVSGVESIIPLRPKGIAMFKEAEESKKDKVYELVIPTSQIRRTYIYIDFPSPVNDGGYFYSIDIGSYVKTTK